jgi:hypothetical protein
MKTYKDNKVKTSKDILSSASATRGCRSCESLKGNRKELETERIEITKAKVLAHREHL